MPNELSTLPQNIIPPSWLYSMTCPVCSCATLTIKQIRSAADEFCCDECMTCFEISQDGQYIRLVTFPAYFPQDFGSNWMFPADIRKLVDDIRRKKNLPVAGDEEQSTLTPEKLIERGRKLHALGNNYPKIERTLREYKQARPEDIEAALVVLKKELSSRGTFWFAVGVSTIVILIVAIVTVVLVGMNKPAAGNEPASIFPAPLQSLLDNQIIKLPNVRVVQYASDGANAKCPTQSANAAKLFGVDAKYWSVTMTGWTMFSSEPKSVYVPKGMSAQYPVFREKPEWVGVTGPAQVIDTVYISITCNN